MASFQPNADLSLGFLFLSFGILPAEGRPGLHCKWKNAKVREGEHFAQGKQRQD